MYLVSHFHYDPVWWNTQAGYTATWELQGDDGSTRPVWEHNGFDLVRAHIEMAMARPGLHVRAGRGRLPQAVLGPASRVPRCPAAT